MNYRDTIIWRPRGKIPHLWIVISDPASHDGRCVVINLTESLHGQYSFILKPGQHPFIDKDSDVNFGDAFETTSAALDEEITAGNAIPRQPMDAQIVSDIIQRAKTHIAFQPILRRLLP